MSEEYELIHFDGPDRCHEGCGSIEFELNEHGEKVCAKCGAWWE
jgi:hypothetical protein